MADGSTPVFGLHPDTSRATGIPGWQGITGHSGKVGMAQSRAAAGFALPELITGGRWKSARIPARYPERQADGRGRWPGTTRRQGVGDPHLTVGRAPVASGRNAGADSSGGRDTDLASCR